MHSATVISRLPASFAPRRAPALLALAAIACLVVAACSPGVDYPSLFPSVHDTPPPRTDTPLDSNQLQQATEELISARDRLSAESKGSAKPSANPATGAAKKQPVRLTPTAASQPPKTDADQSAGAETK